MQSPAQITFWMNLGKRRPEVGGVTFWLGSHQEGVTQSRRNEANHFECVVDETRQKKYPKFDLEADEGDLVVMHSLIWHRSNRNYSKEHGRIVQLFRFSDLSHSQSLKMQWQSTTYPRPSVQYETVHSDLFRR